MSTLKHLQTNKVCSKCKILKDFTNFGKASKSKDNMKSACKECLRTQNKEYMGKISLIDRDLLNERNRNAKKKKVIENPNYYKDEYYKNHERNKKNARNYYHNNVEKCLDGQKKWRSDNRAIYLQCSKIWKINNPERNRKSRRSSTEAYRARKKMAFTVKFTTDQLDERMSVFGFLCAYCGAKFEEIDHVIPLSRGGGHHLSNLRPSCKKCNQSKSNK